MSHRLKTGDRQSEGSAWDRTYRAASGLQSRRTSEFAKRFATGRVARLQIPDVDRLRSPGRGMPDVENREPGEIMPLLETVVAFSINRRISNAKKAAPD